MATRMACREPNCGRAARTRGLCGRHYQRALRRVLAGAATWAGLAAAGVALPAKGRVWNHHLLFKRRAP